MSLLNRQSGLVLAGDDARKDAGSGREAKSATGWRGVSFKELPGEIFSECANLQCRTGWLRLLRHRHTPIFEGGWCCSEACTAARVEAAIRRELDARGSGSEIHRHRIPLGLAMLEQGWITQAQLRSALSAQRETGTGKLGQWLVSQRSATEEQVTRALGLQWSCPVLGMELASPESLTALLPRLFVDAFGALPLRVAAGKLVYLGFEDRPDVSLALAIEHITGLRVESGVVAESQFRPAHERMLNARFPSVELIEAGTISALTAGLARAVEKAQPVEARLARVHDCIWLRLWLSKQNVAVPDPKSIRDVIASASVH
jgi:hypothetical protein